MERLTFIVKGTKEQALDQINKRGISAICLEVLPKMSTTVWQALNPVKDFMPIANWFGENPDIIPGEGYPNGTCLIYSQHEPRED